MFEHLDDPHPHSLGTDHQLAAARSRGRAIVRHRRRTRLAAGSAVVAATAGVSAVAVVGLPGRSAAGVTAGADSPTPVPVPATSRATPVAVPTAWASSPASPVPAPVAATPTAEPTAETASPTPAPVPAITAPPTPLAETPTATTAGVPTTVSPTPVSSDCAAVEAKLRTTPLPDGFTPLVPPSGVVSWSDVGAPINAVVVTVSCSPFDPSQVEAGVPFREVTVLGAHSWLVGDPASGKLQLTWNATATTRVTVAAQVTLPENDLQVENQLLTLGNMLLD